MSQDPSNPPTTPNSPRALVERLKAKGDIRDNRVEAAFLQVPRALFLPNVPPEQVYQDEAIALLRDPDGSVVSSSSQPSMMALMLAQLHLQPGHNVLEIGTGSGYNAALMQHIVGHNGKVTSIEFDPVIASQAQLNLQRAAIGGDVTVVQGDGALGFAPRAAYDRIIATVGVWDLPHAWVRQLKPRGLLVAPIWLEGMQFSAAFHLQADGSLYSERNLPCGFVRLRGVSRGPRVECRVGDSLYLYTGDATALDDAALRAQLSEASETDHMRVRLAAGEFIGGLAPYLILNLPPPFRFAFYLVPEGRQAYGLSERGIAVIGPGSACFLPEQESGALHLFGSADALLILQELAQAWRTAGSPMIDRLRFRFSPKTRGRPEVKGGRTFTRAEHLLSAWFE